MTIRAIDLEVDSGAIHYPLMMIFIADNGQYINVFRRVTIATDCDLENLFHAALIN